MHACWILLCMSLILLSYTFLINKEGIGMRKKSKGGLAGSIPRPVAGGVCYRLVLEPGFDPGTCGLWVHHAFAAPITHNSKKLVLLAIPVTRKQLQQ
jgi:hypothetical protein